MRRRGGWAVGVVAGVIAAGCSGGHASSKVLTSPSSAPSSTTTSTSTSTSAVAATTVPVPVSAAAPTTTAVPAPPTTWAYAENFGEMFAVNMAAGTTRVMNAASYPGSPGWAPDGSVPLPSPDRTKVIWFGNSTQGSVIEADAGGLNPRTISAATDGTVGPGAWSPDGAVVAYPASHAAPANTPPPAEEIVTVNPDGSGHRVVTTTAAVVNKSFEPPLAWSPDGTRIAFVGSADVGSTPIDVVDVATGTVTTLGHVTGQSVIDPHWLAGGQSLLVDADGSIVRVATDGSTRVIVAAGATPVLAFDVSPDRAQIAYYAGESLHVSDVNGAHAQVILRDTPYQSNDAWTPVGAPSWAPDASAILCLQRADPASSISYQTVRVRLADHTVTVVHPWTSPRPFDQEAAW